MHIFDRTEQHLRILVEDLVREGKPEHEIVAAVERARSEGGVVVRGRRPSFFR
jgi:hypothetical protein